MSLALMDSCNPMIESLLRDNKKLRAEIERLKTNHGMTVIDIQDDDALRFVQRVLESQAPEEDRKRAIAMIVEIRTRLRKRSRE